MDILFYISIIKIWYNRLFYRELDFYKILCRNICMNYWQIGDRKKNEKISDFIFGINNCFIYGI